MFFESIWMLINIILLILFIVGIIKVGKLIKEKWGGPATVLFILVIVAFSAKGGRESRHRYKDFKTWEKVRSGLQERTTAIMQQSVVSKYAIDIHFGQDTVTGHYIPLGAGVSHTGLTYGDSWAPGLIAVNASADNRYWQYSVSGVRSWYLLGIMVYSEDMDFNGTTPIKHID